MAMFNRSTPLTLPYHNIFTWSQYDPLDKKKKSSHRTWSCIFTISCSIIVFTSTQRPVRPVVLMKLLFFNVGELSHSLNFTWIKSMLSSKIHYFHGVIPCFVASIMVNFSVFLVLSPSWMSPIYASWYRMFSRHGALSPSKWHQT